MSQITLRNLDPELEKIIRQEARKRKKSLNQVVQELLHPKTGLAKKKELPRGQTLRKYAGGWSDQDVTEFYEAIKSCEQIDEDMWK